MSFDRYNKNGVRSDLGWVEVNKIHGCPSSHLIMITKDGVNDQRETTAYLINAERDTPSIQFLQCWADNPQGAVPFYEALQSFAPTASA